MSLIWNSVLPSFLSLRSKCFYLHFFIPLSNPFICILTIIYVFKITQAYCRIAYCRIAYCRTAYSCIQLYVSQSADCILRLIKDLMKVVKYLHKICEPTLFPNTVKLALKLSLNIEGIFFEVSLTVHLSITLTNYKLDTQIFSAFITILYMYMFRAITCSSSGGQIVSIQHLVSSISVSDRPVHM
jgi:hypothetical protein